MQQEVLDLKKEFGHQYTVKQSEEFKLEKPELRDAVEWYYEIPAKYGQFYPSGRDTIAFHCSANRIKERILRQFKGQVELFLEAEDECILRFHKDVFLEIAPIVKAQKRRGRKNLSEIEKKRLVGAGKEHRFTGKTVQHIEPEQEIAPRHDTSVTV